MASESSNDRVGIRDIARDLGVSLMTVSLALRNSPRVSTLTKAKVKAVAEKLGYRPDPEVARLMSRLRQRGNQKSSATIALVDLSQRSAGEGDRYFNEVRKGAQERADALGFQVVNVMLGELKCGVARLLNILYSRGVTGIVLLPPRNPLTIPHSLDWSKFSVVSTTYAITPHVVHRVVPHQFVDMCSILKRLENAGYQRIGFIFERDFELRTLNNFTAAITLQAKADYILRVDSRNALNRDLLFSWIVEKRPEIIIAPFVEQLQPLVDQLPEGNRPKLYSIGEPDLLNVPYLDQRPYSIGAYGVNLLVGMIHNSEFGLTNSPATTMLHGIFKDRYADIEFS